MKLHQTGVKVSIFITFLQITYSEYFLSTEHAVVVSIQSFNVFLSLFLIGDGKTVRRK